jgi:SAM-dependent methyltransferase
MANLGQRMDFDALYDAGRANRIVVPWDIGGPQPVIQQLVACGALRGEVLDPGTGPGYHAIHYASQGYPTTGIDASPDAIELAQSNAKRAGVEVNFEVADATSLEGFEGRFDTVVDSAFYHVFLEDEERQTLYMQALHRATRPGARLFMFEFGRHNVNGIHGHGLPAENFQRVLGTSGWRLDHIGTSTYVGRFSPETITKMESIAMNADWAERMKPLQEQLKSIGPLLDDYLIHMPIWTVVATRRD